MMSTPTPVAHTGGPCSGCSWLRRDRLSGRWVCTARRGVCAGWVARASDAHSLPEELCQVK
ncbi:hypothetical protein [Desulfovibrio inopinatus]|uniref:hypothetical protein n=1 Tax=Desulfovibrio inopinatus TaxID=102109 RepID=UPI0004161A6F|nr:hypothetical protein [Desulfovibrio inopinatus]